MFIGIDCDPNFEMTFIVSTISEMISQSSTNSTSTTTSTTHTSKEQQSSSSAVSHTRKVDNQKDLGKLKSTTNSNSSSSTKIRYVTVIT